MKFGRLMIVVGVIALIWGVVLPHWAATPEMQAALARRDAAGINGNATYYSDNPSALSGLDAIQELNAEHPKVLWSVRGTQSPRNVSSAVTPTSKITD